MFKKQIKVYAASLLFLIPLQANALPEFITKAPHAIAIDYNTKKPVLEKAADEQMIPSSMTKLMTTYILFDKLKKGQISIQDKFLVSEKAWRMGGSKMFVKVNDYVTVEELIRGIIIQSGNDACIVVAEGISGSEQIFADEMNATARVLGLTGSHFKNSTGWPEEGHYVTARDLAILGMHIISDFPEYYHYFKENMYVYNGIKQYNRNTLIGKNPEVDGLKTGHTEDGGYGMVVSGVQQTMGGGERRVVVVVNGLANEKEREAEADRVYTHAQRDFRHVLFYKKGEQVETANVWLGEETTVPLVANENILMTLSRVNSDLLQVSVEHEGPVTAPIIAGQQIGNLHIAKPEEVDIRIPLYAGKDVGKMSLYNRIITAFKYYTVGN